MQQPTPFLRLSSAMIATIMNRAWILAISILIGCAGDPPEPRKTARQIEPIPDPNELPDLPKYYTPADVPPSVEEKEPGVYLDPDDFPEARRSCARLYTAWVARSRSSPSGHCRMNSGRNRRTIWYPAISRASSPCIGRCSAPVPERARCSFLIPPATWWKSSSRPTRIVTGPLTGTSTPPTGNTFSKTTHRSADQSRRPSCSTASNAASPKKGPTSSTGMTAGGSGCKAGTEPHKSTREPLPELQL